MKIGRNIVFAAVAMMFVILGLIMIYLYDYTRIDYTAVDYITELQKGPSNFLDLSGDIGVESIDDLGFEVKGEYDILIHYGKQVIRVNKQCLDSEEWNSRVGKIGIKVYTKVSEETGKRMYRVTYWGDKIEQWSRVD